MKGHAEKCVERYCEVAHKSVDQVSKRLNTPVLDDNQIRKDDFEMEGELAEVRALYLARIDTGKSCSVFQCTEVNGIHVLLLLLLLLLLRRVAPQVSRPFMFLRCFVMFHVLFFSFSMFFKVPCFRCHALSSRNPGLGLQSPNLLISHLAGPTSGRDVSWTVNAWARTVKK